MARNVNPGAPYSADPMPDPLRNSMVPVTIIAIVSMICTGSLLSYLSSTYPRARTMRRHFTPQYQNIVLIFNLLLGDFIQSLGFGLDAAWLLQRKVHLGIACNLQGTLIQVGDMVGSLFVMSIAVHTFTYVVLRKSISKTTLICWVGAAWTISLVSGIVLPLIARGYRDDGQFYWTLTHYIFIFFDQIVCISVYLAIYIKLVVFNHSRGSDLGSSSNGKVEKAARLMIIYPLAYIFCTLPLAAIRVHTMLGGHPSLRISAIFGTIFASSGIVNTVLYGVTRTLRRSRRNTNMPGGLSHPHQKLSDFEPLRYAPEYAVTATIKSEGGLQRSRDVQKPVFSFLERSTSRVKPANSIHIRSETVMKSEPMPPSPFISEKSERRRTQEIESSLNADDVLELKTRIRLDELDP